VGCNHIKYDTGCEGLLNRGSYVRDLSHL
jgi:hypothetical protein